MIIFDKSGVYTVYWSKEKGCYLRKKPKKYMSFSLLSKPCKIKKGVTLGDILNWVKDNKYLKVFFSQYSHCDVEAFIAQSEIPYSPPEKEEDKLEKLEIFWVADQDEDNGKKKVYFSPGFHAIGTPDPSSHYYPEDGGSINYSIALTPVNELVHLPVVLNKKLDIYGADYNKSEIEFSAENDFTLLDVLHAIFWEISFYGGPNTKKEFKESINAKMDEIKADHSELLEIDDVFKALGVDPPPETPKSDNDKPAKKILFHPDILKDLGIDPD